MQVKNQIKRRKYQIVLKNGGIVNFYLLGRGVSKVFVLSSDYLNHRAWKVVKIN